MGNRLKIGDFARLAGVSVKTLRFYADEGILLPREVDPDSGYRLYDADQVGEAIRILNLREAGVSLADIKSLSANEQPDLIAKLRQQRAYLLKEKAKIEGKLNIVEGLVQAISGIGPVAIEQIRIVSIEPEFVYSVRAQHDVDSGVITDAFEHAESVVSKGDARANRSPFLLVHRSDTGEYRDVEVCIPVRDDRIDALPVRLIAGAQIACAATFVGAYTQSADVEGHLRDWIREAGLVSAGPVREVYRKFGADQADYTLPTTMVTSRGDQYVTELQIALNCPT
ncbi:MAG: MerR family transcriptional regulator [Pseudomonadota bacterium]